MVKEWSAREVPRLRELNVKETALAFVRTCFEHCATELMQLRPLGRLEPVSEDELASTALYRSVRRLVAYAVHGEDPKVPLEQLLEPLTSFAISPLWERVDLEGIASSVNVQNGRLQPIEVVLAGAFARTRLEEEDSVTTTDLAVLAGLSRAAVIGVIKSGALSVIAEGKRGTGGAYVVAADDARRWLLERGVPGITERAPRPSLRTVRRSRPT